MCANKVPRNSAVGLIAEDMGLKPVNFSHSIKKAHIKERVIALGGNPNVGKSTVFNELTGLRQHTGNWPGKTVESAQGRFSHKGDDYVIVDLPGCYSLMAYSLDEEVARDFICLGNADVVVAVCDATCLERSMNLVLQILEITQNVVVCVNLMDEAEKKGIKINLNIISQRLKVPVIGTSARSKKGIRELMDEVALTIEQSAKSAIQIGYPDYIEEAISEIIFRLKPLSKGAENIRWISLMLLHHIEDMSGFLGQSPGSAFLADENVVRFVNKIGEDLSAHGITEGQIKDDIVSSIVQTAENICADAVVFENDNRINPSKAERLLTGKLTAFPIMILALLGIFWLTITGSNYPSRLISDCLFRAEEPLLMFFKWLGAPQTIREMLVLGVYRVLAWVISVMLPPMAIFFPLFTLLEDVGFLPRIAFNLDKCFKKCSSCGKQALTMCIQCLSLQKATPYENFVKIVHFKNLPSFCDDQKQFQ